MRFRFSLKWLLFVMVYAAVAAAAFSHGHWAYADILWTASFVAFGYALLLVCVERGPRQSGALGFVIFFACYLLCLFFAPDGLPTSRLLVALGAVGEEPLAIPSPAVPTPWQLRVNQPPPSGGNLQLQSGTFMYSTGVATITAAPANPAAVGKSYIAGLNFQIKLRSANAVGAMIAGFIGCLAAAVASRRHRPANNISP
jgi:hypothetical protein